MKHVRLLFVVVGILMSPVASFAQDAHWGISGGFVPKWKVPSQLETLFDGNVDIEGSEFAVGFVRGRDLGGDWGVSFVRKSVKDGSVVESFEEQCGFTNGCFQDGKSYKTNGVTISGVEIHKFLPFGTIRNRVQIGLNLAGGIGTFSGDLDTIEKSITQTFTPGTGTGSGTSAGTQVTTTTTEPASELLPLSFVPLVKIQVAVAIIATPNFKIKFAGGLDVPGINTFGVTGVFFFGAR